MSINRVTFQHNKEFITFIAPAGISPRGEIPWAKSLRGQLEKLSICSKWGREESVGNDDVSIVCARKYEMVRMT